VVGLDLQSTNGTRIGMLQVQRTEGVVNMPCQLLQSRHIL